MAYAGHDWTNVPDPKNPGNAVALSADTLNAMEDGIRAAIRRDGDVMDGELLLNGSYENNKSAVPKEYVDSVIKYYSKTITVPANTTAYIDVCTIENFDWEKQMILLHYCLTGFNTLGECWAPVVFKNSGDSMTVVIGYHAYVSPDPTVCFHSDGKVTFKDNVSTASSRTIDFLVIPIEKNID